MPIRLLLACFGLVILVAGWVYCLFRVWGLSSDYSDRYVILLAAGYLAYRNYPYLQREPVQPIPAAGLGILLCGLGLFPVYYLASQAISNSVLTLWQTMMTLASLFFFSLAYWGWRRTQWLLFPLFFCFFSLPLPDPILVPLRNQLQVLATKISVFMLQTATFDVKTTGFIIELPGGPLEVIEACSGIRSLTAITAIAVFVAYFRGFRWARGILLFLLSIPIVCLCNALRIFLTGMIQELAGREYTEGFYHTALGFLTIGLGLGFTLLVSTLMEKIQPTPPRDELSVQKEIIPDCPGLPLVCVLVAVSALVGVSIWGVQRINLTEYVFDSASIPLKLGEWEGKDLKYHEEIRDLLGTQNVTCRIYTNPIGRSINVWIMHWNASSLAVRGHHPEICLPNRGFVPTKPESVTFPLNSCQLAVTRQWFSQNMQESLVEYWTQEGGKIVSDGELQKINSLSSIELTKYLLTTRVNEERKPRLGFLIGTEIQGTKAQTERMLGEFTKQFADSLYQAYPWAKPTPALP